MIPSAHRDTFARDNLPPRETWPELLFERPELQYPPRLNAATELLDRQVEFGHGDRPAIWQRVDGMPLFATYAQLQHRVNRIARDDAARAAAQIRVGDAAWPCPPSGAASSVMRAC
jgi:2-aminobenzoate-CoA ligase